MADKPSSPPSSKSPSKLPAAPPESGPPAALPGAPQWNRLAIGGGIVALLWVTAFATGSKIFVGVVAVVTVVVAGVLVWIFRWARKQREMMQIVQGGSGSKEARREALAKLAAQSGADKDVMNAVARAQLEAQDDPDKALATLEAIDMNKVPGPMADDVRVFRAQLYLVKGRSKEARVLADEVKLSQAGSTESRGMAAATVAEAWARTGKHKEALDLLQTIKPDDPDFKAARVPLLFARVYASFAAGQRDGVRRDMTALIRQDPNLLARFVEPRLKPHPELQKIAKEMLVRSPEGKRLAKQQFSRRPR